MKLSVEDRFEIQDLLARYCMALDTKNFDEFVNVMTDDVEWDYSDEFDEPLYGREAATETIRKSLEPHPASLHVALYNLAWATGPDTAEGYSQVLSKSVLDGAPLPARPETTFEVFCRWHDSYVRTDEGWRIKKRKLAVWATSGDPEVWDPDTIAGKAFRGLMPSSRD